MSTEQDAMNAFHQAQGQDASQAIGSAAGFAAGAAAGAEALSGNAGRMLSAAQGGGFSITPEAGQAMLSAIDQASRELVDAALSAFHGNQGSPLGSSPVARVVAPFNEQVWNGGRDSYDQAQQKLRDTLMQMRDAVATAMRNYSAADAHASSSLRGGLGE